MTHAFCFFYSIGRQVRWGTSLALAHKKTIALRARRGPPPDVAPVLGESGAGVTASSAGLAPFTVVPMPSVSQVVDEAEGAPLEAAAQPATKVILLPTSERAGLPLRPRCQERAVVSPPCPQIQGRRAPRSCPDEGGRELGVHPLNVSIAQQR